MMKLTAEEHRRMLLLSEDPAAFREHEIVELWEHGYLEGWHWAPVKFDHYKPDGHAVVRFGSSRRVVPCEHLRRVIDG